MALPPNNKNTALKSGAERIQGMKVAQGITEELKCRDQMAWVGAMNSIRNRAEEIILREMIYGEDVA